MRTVRRHLDFEADFIAQLDWLARHGFRRWILELRTGLDEVTGLIARFPHAGSLVDERGTVELRKVFWKRGPYLAWYVHDRAARRGDLWLVRLFHARQRRPKPNPAKWLPSR
jgi:plasmid stabilization system protein ParE